MWTNKKEKAVNRAFRQGFRDRKKGLLPHATIFEREWYYQGYIQASKEIENANLVAICEL